MGVSPTDIRYFHEQGCSVLEISQITGMKRPIIYYWLGQFGLDPNISRRPTLTVFQLGNVFKMYRSGMTQADIARELDVPVHQIRYAMSTIMARRAT